MTEKHRPTGKAAPADPPRRRKRRWFRALLRWGIRLVLLAVVLIVLVRHVAAPSFWRWATRSFLKNYWSGPMDIGSVDFNFADGTAVLSNVSLRDSVGRQWVHIESLTYYLRDWPSFRPILHEIHVDEPAATVYLDEGQVNLPVKGAAIDEMLDSSTPPASPPSRWDVKYYIEVEKTFLNDISLVVVESDPHFPRDTIPPTELGLLQNLRFYGTASAGGDLTLTHGDRTDAHARAEFRVNLSRLIVRDLRSLLGRGPLENGAQIKPLVLHDVHLPRITYHDGTLEIPRFSVKVGEGRLRGEMKMHVAPDRPATFTGNVQAHRVPLRAFYDAYDPTQKVRYGYASVLIDDIAGTTGDPRDLEMDGAVAMDDSDLDQVHVIEDVFRALHVERDNIRRGSDLRMIFELRGGVMTLAQARLGNNLVAVIAEPDGTVDIIDHRMDLRILGGTLNDLGKIPILGWAANSVNQLTALRVTGDWNRPRIRVEPIRNVTSGVASFFRDVARTGGDLTGLEKEE
ncbi:MAG: hypothetical protein JW849_05190 [Phycisphaerae bacterium]|nr:hypothetical protein [Phycisphaerae bacterium]